MLAPAHDAFLNQTTDRQADRDSALEQEIGGFIEGENGAALPAPGSRHRELHGQRRLARTRRTQNEQTRARLRAASKQGVERLDIAWHWFAFDALTMLGRRQTRKDLHSSPPNQIVVPAAPVRCPSYLGEPQPPPIRPVLRRELLEVDDPVHDALHVTVAIASRSIIQQQNRAPPVEKELFQLQQLAPVPKRILREQPDFRERIDNDAVGVRGVDIAQDSADRFEQFDFRRREHRHRAIGGHRLSRCDVLPNVEIVDGPAVAGRRRDQLAPAF